MTIDEFAEKIRESINTNEPTAARRIILVFQRACYAWLEKTTNEKELEQLRAVLVELEFEFEELEKFGEFEFLDL